MGRIDRAALIRDIAHGRVKGAGWLAGYPRSGAALVRTILANCFDLPTSSIYRENLGADYVEKLKAVGMDEIGAGPTYVKTHEFPGLMYEPITIPTIVIVRDARRVFESLREFMSKFNGVNIPMSKIIKGDHYWGDWSSWCAHWAEAAPDALWLRYEDLMTNLRPAVDVIAVHIGQVPTNYTIPDFHEMSIKTPGIFRRASMTGNGGMNSKEESLFWKEHGETMEFLGYSEEVAANG